MLSTEALIETDRPSRYLIQLCEHAAAMAGTRGHRPRMHAGGGSPAHRDVQVHAEWSDTDGCIRFGPWGTCTITTDPAGLMLRVEAPDAEKLQLIQDVLAGDIGRFGRRDQLTVDWHSLPAAGG
jgi:hypothetical protein